MWRAARLTAAHLTCLEVPAARQHCTAVLHQLESRLRGSSADLDWAEVELSGLPWSSPAEFYPCCYRSPVGTNVRIFSNGCIILQHKKYSLFNHSPVVKQMPFSYCLLIKTAPVNIFVRESFRHSIGNVHNNGETERHSWHCLSGRLSPHPGKSTSSCSSDSWAELELSVALTSRSAVSFSKDRKMERGSSGRRLAFGVVPENEGESLSSESIVIWMQESAYFKDLWWQAHFLF